MHIPLELLKLPAATIAKRLGVSRQGVLAAIRRAKGLCPGCGSTATHGVFCKRHYAANLKTQRDRYGHKPWKPGGRGRPPVIVHPPKKKAKGD